MFAIPKFKKAVDPDNALGWQKGIRVRKNASQNV